MDTVDPRIDPALLPVGSRALVIAKDQPEYQPLPAVITPSHAVVTRWTFNDIERRAIANGEDLYLTIYGTPIRPVFLSVGVRDWTQS